MVEPGRQAPDVVGRLARGAWSMARRVPLAGRALDGVVAAEQVVVEALYDRLRRLDVRSAGQPALGGGSDDRPSPADRMQQLLQRAESQTPTEARSDAIMWILGQMVPDEARIVAALADGSAYPVVHVSAGPVIGPGSERLVRNVSSVGRAAHVRSAELSANYVTHLLELGLVDLGSELPGLGVEYEILETEPAVRTGLAHAEHRRTTRVRVVRQSLHLSERGQSFWQACQDRTDPGQGPA